VVSGDELDQLISLWEEYDPNATGWISVENLVFLLYELPKPLGPGKEVFDSRDEN
jgi:Ca2+-binding EF-hand superfamily protein